jgi:hypothetical protein
VVVAREVGRDGVLQFEALAEDERLWLHGTNREARQRDATWPTG